MDIFFYKVYTNKIPNFVSKMIFPIYPSLVYKQYKLYLWADWRLDASFDGIFTVTTIDDRAIAVTKP